MRAGSGVVHRSLVEDAGRAALLQGAEVEVHSGDAAGRLDQVANGAARGFASRSSDRPALARRVPTSERT